MAIIKDLSVTFPIGDWDLSDPDGLKAKIISLCDNNTLESCLQSLNAQATHMVAGPAPRGEAEIRCQVDHEGKVSCSGGVKWRW